MNIIAEILKLKEAVKRCKLLDGANYKTEINPNGTRLFISQSQSAEQSTGGTSIKWAKVTAVTDANNYTTSIYASFDFTGTALETGKVARVGFIINALSVNDGFPVKASSISGVDYECIQQIGLL